ncbi:hypothetical protein DICVIV_10785 [Dictyocaulus viviparus]|uniref:Protein asunder n=1 Tax=Dictyocaulus viviparus TaxID=29172 RepID=A0A0D8XF02_DICVI|nr:hypothetical protein DICVIV_10785 [Dictyocaulus viviparus]
MKIKRTVNARIIDFVTLIKECILHIPKDSNNKISASSPSDVICAQPRRHLLRITRYWPLRSDECFIYNIPKRFDSFFTIIRQPQLSTLDCDKCRQVFSFCSIAFIILFVSMWYFFKIIHQLMTLRDSKERLFESYVDTRLVRDKNDRVEQLQIANAELARHLGNYIFQLFTQLAGLERMAKLLNSDVTLMDRTHIFKKLTLMVYCITRRQEGVTLNNFNGQPSSVSSSSICEMKNLSRSNSPLPKKSRKTCHLWKPNETLNLYDYLVEKEERSHRSHSIDFVGRIKAGSRPASLYPSLEGAVVSAKQD